MTTKKKILPIKPLFMKNEKGKVTNVFLPYDVYEAILGEIDKFAQEVKKDKEQAKRKRSARG